MMRTTYYLNGARISKQNLVKQFGSERVNRLTAEAKEGFMEDPFTQQDFFLGGGAGMLTIAFS